MHARQHMSYTCDYAGPRSLGFYVFIACIVFYGCFCIYIAQCVSTGDLVLLLVHAKRTFSFLCPVCPHTA